MHDTKSHEDCWLHAASTSKTHSRIQARHPHHRQATPLACWFGIGEKMPTHRAANREIDGALFDSRQTTAVADPRLRLRGHAFDNYTTGSSYFYTANASRKAAEISSVSACCHSATSCRGSKPSRRCSSV